MLDILGPLVTYLGGMQTLEGADSKEKLCVLQEAGLDI